MREPEVAALFDADNHYWETSDAFTRHRDPAFADRGLQVKEVDGVMRYVIDGEVVQTFLGRATTTPGRHRGRSWTTSPGSCRGWSSWRQ